MPVQPTTNSLACAGCMQCAAVRRCQHQRRQQAAPHRSEAQSGCHSCVWGEMYTGRITLFANNHTPCTDAARGVDQECRGRTTPQKKRRQSTRRCTAPSCPALQPLPGETYSESEPTKPSVSTPPGHTPFHNVHAPRSPTHHHHQAAACHNPPTTTPEQAGRQEHRRHASSCAGTDNGPRSGAALFWVTHTQTQAVSDHIPRAQRHTTPPQHTNPHTSLR